MAAPVYRLRTPTGTGAEMLQFKSANGSRASRRWAKSGKTKTFPRGRRLKVYRASRWSAIGIIGDPAQKTVLDEAGFLMEGGYVDGRGTRRGHNRAWLLERAWQRTPCDAAIGAAEELAVVYEVRDVRMRAVECYPDPASIARMLRGRKELDPGLTAVERTKVIEVRRDKHMIGVRGVHGKR